ncbi:MAG: hypothetical protein V3T30_03310, partial [Thermodesulfobacteriota bacterium]
MAYYQDDKHTTVFIFALALIAIQVADLLILIKRLSIGAAHGENPIFFLIEFAVIYLFYYLVMDRSWKFGTMFIGLSVVLEYF